MERKLGEIFICNGKLYQVVKSFSCRSCAFIKNGNCYLDDKLLGPCAYTERTDKTSVIFKLINNMEIKNNQLIINIPEGMEIDLENSNFDTGVIYFKKKQSEFKDGDILYVKTKKIGSEYIIINKLSEEAKTVFYVAYNLSSKKIFWNLIYFVCCDKEISILRQATDYEKFQLFDALAKKNKAWDSEKKQIVDLKSKWITLKPFDKVLVRDGKNEIWEPAFFFRNRPELNVYKYQTVDGKLRVYCIPFNEETAKLIGTSNDWKE